MKGILIVDHGSRKHEENDMLRSMADLIQTMPGSDVIVRYAHMELADPTIAAGFSSCVQAGAIDVTVFPYMLSPGRHSIVTNWVGLTGMTSGSPSRSVSPTSISTTLLSSPASPKSIRSTEPEYRQ